MVSMDIIQIKCPWCSAVLAVRNQAGMETKNVTCPVCKRVSPFANFKRYTAPQEENTCYPTSSSNGIGATNNNIGVLVNKSTGIRYDLKLGENVIGRRAAVSNATIGIDVESGKKISREHLIISVSNVAGRGLVYKASLYKERVNTTSINDVPLKYGDCVLLKHGDVINFPELDIVFEIPDPDMTEI